MTPMLDRFSIPDQQTLTVPEVYYRRHLGLPPCAQLDEHLTQLTENALAWYQQHASPWTTVRAIGIDDICGNVIQLENSTSLLSPMLAKGLAQADARELVVVAATAGEAVDQQIAALWKDERPDEAMFLNSYAIAAVEHLRWTLGEHLSRTYQEQGMTVLPHYSPGYEGWGLEDQHKLFALIAEERAATQPLEILESGCLRPLKSTLAAYGITNRTDLGKLDEYWTKSVVLDSATTATPTHYAFPERTLDRWREKRLSFNAFASGKIEATFRIDGSTCTNMGTPLAFEYRVSLRREADAGYRILAVSCAPVENEKGYQAMCAYLDNPERFMAGIKEYRPLVGQLLSEAVTWEVSTSPAGCLCTRPSQDHKWRIVLQTIHYALESNKL